MFNFTKVFFVLFFFSQIIFAQAGLRQSKLPEIVVTATKTETPASELANSVTIIDSEEIELSHKNSVVDLIKDETGVAVVQQGGPGKLSNFFIRGGNSNHTLVLVDGVELNDPSSPNNAYDLSMLQTNNIDRIEIVRGPQSTLYGSDAMAGVINIITKKGSGAPGVSLLTEGGSNGHFKGNINTSGKYKFVNFSAGYSRLYTDGISVINESDADEKDSYENNSASANIGFELGSKTNLNFSYRFMNSENELDQSNKFGDDPNYVSKNEEQLFRGEFDTDLLNRFWKVKFSSSYLRRISNGLDEKDERNLYSSSRTHNDAARLKFELQNNFYLSDKNILTLGFERETEQANTDYFSESEYGPYSTLFPEKSVWNNSAYLQAQIQPAKHLFTTSGVRYDNHEKFGSIFTYRAAAAYFLSPTNTKLKATFGTGFKAPSLYYLYDPSFGNPDLEPEKNLGWDAGFQQFFFKKGLSFEVVYFQNSYEDIFGFDENFRTINIDKVETHGVEAGLKLLNLDNFNISSSYTYTVSKNESKGSEDYGLQLLRRPKHKGLLSIDYNRKKLFAGLDIRYVGERDDKDFSVTPFERVKLSDYVLFDINASFKLNSNFEIFGKINNLFDRDYEEVLFYGTLGRAFYLGLKINY